jgi:hypothetical protein
MYQNILYGFIATVTLMADINPLQICNDPLSCPENKPWLAASRSPMTVAHTRALLGLQGKVSAPLGNSCCLRQIKSMI